MNNLLYELSLKDIHYFEFKLLKRVLKIENGKVRILKEMPSKEELFIELITK